MEITCYRDQELACETHHLAAATYNLALTLLTRSTTGNLFVPIRSMQYLAILDHEEWVFLDGERKCWIDVAWRHFKPQARSSLEDPVEYEVAFYQASAQALMVRLLADLPRALHDLAKKAHVEGPARVLKFPAPKTS